MQDTIEAAKTARSTCQTPSGCIYSQSEADVTTCDPNIDTIPAMLAQLDADLRVGFAAAALAEACRLRAPVQEMLVGVSRSGNGSLTVVAPAIAAEPDLWTRACPAGLGVFEAMRDASALGTIYDQCDLGKLGFATREEFAAAPGAPLAAILVHPLLVDAGATPATQTALLRGLAGIVR